MEPELLTIEKISTGYGALQVLWDVSLSLGSGEAVILLGANGAGKTTLLKALVGLIPAWEGHVRLGNVDFGKMRADERARHGLSLVTETGILPNLSVEENLAVGGFTLSRSDLKERMAMFYDEFPDLKRKRRILAGSLSGGQRKMLAVAKSLMGQPRVLLMDEPSAGLSPLFVKEVIGLLQKYRGPNLSLLIAEQNVKFLDMADRVYVLDSGRIRFQGTVSELQANDAIRQAYFGLSGPEF